jgi:hypothetical protein
MRTGLPRKQKGAAAIEFALVFVVFFAVFYGMVSYSLPLLLMQSFNQATAEAVRRSVAVDPTSPNYQANLGAQAAVIARQQLKWIPKAFNFDDGYVTGTFDGVVLKVAINYPTTNLKRVLPFIVLPGIGTVPNLPATLSAQSSLQF